MLSYQCWGYVKNDNNQTSAVVCNSAVRHIAERGSSQGLNHELTFQFSRTVDLAFIELLQHNF